MVASIPALAERGVARTIRFFEMLNQAVCQFVAGDRHTIADILALVTVSFAAGSTSRSPMTADTCSAGMRPFPGARAPSPDCGLSVR
jgi:glutathione S-transferase